MRESDKTVDKARQNTSSHPDANNDKDSYRNSAGEDPEGYRIITRAQDLLYKLEIETHRIERVTRTLQNQPSHHHITQGMGIRILQLKSHCLHLPSRLYATDGSNDKGVMGAGFFQLDEQRGGCCQLGRGEEGNSSNRAELGAACLAIEDSKRQQDRKPVILFSDSACFLSSSQKWTGEGKSPSMHGNPDADIMRDIVQLLRERIDRPRPPHNFHQDKGSSRRPFERTSGQMGR